MKRTKSRKWKTIVLPVVVIALIIAFMFVVGVGLYGLYYKLIPSANGGNGYVCDESVSCTDDNTCDLCTCPDSFDKVRESAGPYAPGWIYVCVPEVEPLPYTFPIDPNDPEFENKVVAYAEDYLQEHFPTCNTISCEPPMYRDVYSMVSSGENLGYAECLQPIGDVGAQSFWRIIFYLEDGSTWEVRDPVCVSN